MRIISFGFFLLCILSCFSPLLEAYIPTHFLLPLSPFFFFVSFFFVLIGIKKELLNFANNLIRILTFLGFAWVTNFQTGYLEQTDDKCSESAIRVVSLNCGQHNNLQEIADFIQNQKPDIVFLQEFGRNAEWKNRSATIQEMKNALNLHQTHFAVQDDNIYGLAVFSDYPILSSKELFLPISEMNGIIEYEILVYGDTLNFTHVHLSSYSLDTGFSVSNLLDTDKERAKLISDFITPSAAKTDFIVGDFNTIPCSKEYFELKKLGFKDLTISGGYTMWPLPLRIDYVFGKTEACNSQTIHSLFSDHQLLSIDLAI